MYKTVEFIKDKNRVVKKIHNLVIEQIITKLK